MLSSGPTPLRAATAGTVSGGKKDRIGRERQGNAMYRSPSLTTSSSAWVFQLAHSTHRNRRRRNGLFGSS